MEDVLGILEIFASDVYTSDKIVKLGIVKKTIGSINFISPKNKNIKGISFVILNNKINSLELVLKKSIEFEILLKEFNKDYLCNYNHYDNVTVINFNIGNPVSLYCTLDGYNEKDNLFKAQVSRYNLRLLESPQI